MQCQKCGKEFSGHRNWNTDMFYCSRSCQHSDLIINQCEVCGNDFEILRYLKSVKKYCSTSCRNKAYWQRKKNTPAELKDTELAYLAGFIDGEGTISVRRHTSPHYAGGYRYMPILEFSNTHVGVMQYFQAMFSGKKYNVTKHETAYCKRCYRMTFNSNIQKWLLPELVPYLVIKKQQAYLLIRFQSLFNSKKYAANDPVLEEMKSIYQQLHQMNHRGPYLKKKQKAHRLLKKDEKQEYDRNRYKALKVVN